MRRSGIVDNNGDSAHPYPVFVRSQVHRATFVMLLLLVGFLVVATDAPCVSAETMGDRDGSPFPSEEDVSEERWPSHHRRLHMELPLGVPTPSLPRMLNLSLPTIDPDEVYLGVYEEAWTTCLDSLWNTCVGRCGQALTGAPYVCGCDSGCRLYGDCCLDYDLECTFEVLNDTESDFARHMGEMDCVSAARDSKYGVLMVSACADWWPPVNFTEYEETIQAECVDPSDNSLHPVKGHHGFIYKNNFCAMCNGVFNAEPWSGTTQCSGTTQTLENDTGNATSVVGRRAAWLDSCSVQLEERKQETQDDYRVCTFDVSDCSQLLADRSATVRAAALNLCSAYSKPVFRSALDGSTPTYKNVHCAHCNNVPSGKLYCPAWRYIPTGANPNDQVNPYLFFETGVEVNADDQIKQIPASFAILFNFGQESDVPLPIFSSQQKGWWDQRQTNCQDDELWDPFSEMCRKIYCSSEFSLLDFQCIDVYDNVSTSDEGVVIPDNVTQALLAVDVSSVLITLYLQLDECVSEQLVQVMDDEFLDVFAESLNVSASRFTNFTVVNITSYLQTATNDSNSTTCARELQVALTLLGPDPTDYGPQPSIEMVSASVAYSVSLNHLFLYFTDAVTARVFGLQEKLTKLVNSTSNDTVQWCADGQQVVYQNGGFTPLIHFYSSSNYTVDIYINSTGRTYPPGQFLGNIMFQGDQRSTLANVTGLVVVCEMDHGNGSCVGVMINHTQYVPLPNGSIAYVGANTYIKKIYDPGSYNILPNGNAIICVSVVPTDGGGGGLHRGDQLSPMRIMDMQIQSMMSTMLLSYSSLAMVVTIVTYLCFAELRNVPGRNLLNLTFISLVYQITFLSGMRASVTEKPTVCKGVAIGLHYSILSSFFWMNVIAYNLYKTFAGDNLMANSGGDKAGRRAASSGTATTCWYAVYAYGCPLFIVGTCTALDVTDTLDIDYGEGGACWIGSPMALLLTFAVVIALVLLVNLVFYVQTVRSIRRISRKTALTTGQRGRQSELAIYVRMSSAMGFTWLFGFLSGIPDLPYAAYDVFSYLFVILNTLQGIFIFFAFVCTGKVMRLYAQSPPILYARNVWAKWRRARQKPIARTISNETCKSVISVDDDDDNDGRHQLEEKERCKEGILIAFQDDGDAEDRGSDHCQVLSVLDNDCLFVENAVHNVGNDVLNVGNNVQMVGNDVQMVGNDVQMVRNDVQMVRNDVQMVRNDVQMVRNDVQMVGIDVQIVGNDIQIDGNDVQMVGNDNKITGSDAHELKKDYRDAEVVDDDIDDCHDSKIDSQSLDSYGQVDDTNESAEITKHRVQDFGQKLKSTEVVDNRDNVTNVNDSNIEGEDNTIDCQKTMADVAVGLRDEDDSKGLEER